MFDPGQHNEMMDQAEKGSTAAPAARNQELAVVIPVFNEQASVRKVVLEWVAEIENWTESFQVIAIDDGSTDDSARILRRLAEQLGDRIDVVTQANAGHGQACLRGYREACARGSQFILQIDSDGQCDPQYFFRFWRMRHEYPVIFGRRTHRDDGFRRVIATHILRLWLLVFARVWCIDPNVPYRLLRREVLESAIGIIPPRFDLANVALSVVLERSRHVRCAAVPIRFRERYGGEPTIPISRFADKAATLRRQLRALPAEIPKPADPP